MARKKGEGSFKKQGKYHVWTLVTGTDVKTGKPKTKVIKRESLKDLKTEVKQYIRDRDEKKPAAMGNTITGDAWADLWLSTVKLTRADRTYVSYKGTWDNWLQKRLGKKRLDLWNSADIQACVNEAIEGGHDRTAGLIADIARRMLNAASRQKPPYVKFDPDEHPCAGIETPSASPERVRILSHDEVEEVLGELYRAEPMITREGVTYAYGHRHVIRFALETGLRRAEVCGLQMMSVDLLSDEPEIHVRAQAGFKDGKLAIVPYIKGKRIRSVPLSEAAIQALKEHQKLVKGFRAQLGDDYQEHLLAFPSEEGTPINPHNLWRSVDRLRDTINERRRAEGKPPRENWTPHDLRRTFGTRIAQAGANLKETQTLMGHANPTTTAKIYIIAEKDGMRKAVRNMRNRKNA